MRELTEFELAVIAPRLPNKPRGVKELMKAVIVSLVRNLPWGARQAIFEDLARGRASIETLNFMAKELGLSHFCATGEWGTFRSDIGDTLLLPMYGKSGTWSVDILKAFEQLFEESNGGTYLDIGANIGLTTVPIAQNPRVTCVAFEPEPRNFANLAANVLLNCPAGNVELRNTALFDRSTTLPFELSDTNFGDHRLRLSNNKGAMQEEKRSVIMVAAQRLDDSLAINRWPVAAKIDVQGAEPFILAGGAKILGSCALLAIEFAPYMMARMGCDPLAVVTFLSKNFATARTRRGDGTAPSKERLLSPHDRIAEVCARLQAFALENLDKPDPHLDILASK